MAPSETPDPVVIEPKIVADSAVESVMAEPTNPVSAILDALPEQILAWYRPEPQDEDPEVQVAMQEVLDGLGADLLEHFRASRGSADTGSNEGIRIAA
jgi:hypothetical protein